MDGDIRKNSYDDGSTDFETGEQKIRNFNPDEVLEQVLL